MPRNRQNSRGQAPSTKRDYSSLFPRKTWQGRWPAVPLFPELDGPFPSGDKNEDDPRLPASTSPHIIRTLKGAGLYVGGQVETAPVDWIVDTGCTRHIGFYICFWQVTPWRQTWVISPFPWASVSWWLTFEDFGEAQFNISVGSKQLFIELWSLIYRMMACLV